MAQAEVRFWRVASGSSDPACHTSDSYWVEADKEETNMPDYQSLLATAKENPASVDFGQLRLAFSQSTGYDPYNPEQLEEDASLEAAMQTSNWPGVLRLCESALARNYVRIHAHLCAAAVNSELNDPIRLQHHQAFVEGLFQSILSSGDGRTSQTAFVVIAIWEEYDVLALLGLTNLGQALCEEGDRLVDRITMIGRDRPEPFDLYFDVTIPMGHFSRSQEGKL